MRLSRGGAGAGVFSAHPVVSIAMEYEQTKMTTTGMEMGSLGGASEPPGPACSSIQTKPAVVPSSPYDLDGMLSNGPWGSEGGFPSGWFDGVSNMVSS